MKYFNEIKKNISQALVLTFPNLQKPFDVDIYASGSAMGTILMRGKIVFYHYNMFDGGFLDQPTYYNELYSLVQDVKKWKHYLMEKKKIIHIHHYYSICKPKVSFNKPNITSGWGFCNNFI
jgi:hypothetical protein